ncbi:MAG: penicillin-binding protein 2 [Rikenellaceae bacterium]
MDQRRVKTLQVVVILLFVIVAARLFYIQVIDTSYKMDANNNVLRYEVQYPPRGEVYDRNGEFLVQNRETYDLMVVPREVKAFDTLELCQILEVSIESMRRELRNASYYSRIRPSTIFKQLSKEIKLKFDEKTFPGFYTVYRTVRYYPTKMAGNLLGYVGEVNQTIIDRNPYYKRGDYIGMSGIEQSYEQYLRGEKGVNVRMVNVHGVTQGSYADGMYDTLATHGTSITCTISKDLQALAEELLKGKVGSVVAIEPQTGEILVMASSPTYDPDLLIGPQRGNNYMDLLNDKRRPLFNRAVMANYPPGSTFKVVNGLIGIEEGVLKTTQQYSCYGGYPVGRGVKCHSHWSPVTLEEAIQTSCNTYFCYVMRDLLENPKYNTYAERIDKWAEYVRSFGFGRKLDSDFYGELNGNVPSSAFYNNAYRGHWNSLTVMSLAIGQGELGCTPLQIANLAATVANRGHYYIPHVVKRIHDRDSIDARFYEPHYTMVQPEHFDQLVEGMYRAVNVPGGTATSAMLEGLDVCGKTGTAQNSHGRDHSTFMSFAPRNDPKIAISVYIENGGFGATIAVPIASLITELYLTDTIKRTALLDYAKNLTINYPHYAKTE